MLAPTELSAPTKLENTRTLVLLLCQQTQRSVCLCAHSLDSIGMIWARTGTEDTQDRSEKVNCAVELNSSRRRSAERSLEGPAIIDYFTNAMEMNCSLGFFFYSMSTYYAQLSQFSCLSRTFSALTLNRSITIVPQLGFASFALCNSEITHSHRPKTVKCSNCRCAQEPLQQICLLYVFFQREAVFLLPLLHIYTEVIRLDCSRLNLVQPSLLSSTCTATETFSPSFK